MFALAEGEDRFEGCGVSAGVQACFLGSVEFLESHVRSPQIFFDGRAFGCFQRRAHIRDGQLEAGISASGAGKVGLIL
ncbi:hypothetical protein [Nocardia sp. NPDC049707]|uniref:hypothetical protein n=1 Tax=Nocardia sp. NPDC049707 TaxID=3154735 RepID=UPI00343B6A40